MSKDLSIFNLANRATLESLEFLGPKTETQVFLPQESWDAQHLQFLLGADVDPLTVRVVSDGLSLSYDSGVFAPPDSVPGLGKFMLSPVEGGNLVVLAEAPAEKIRITYATTQESGYSVFRAEGSGFRYVTTADVMGVPAVGLNVLSDRELEFKVPATRVAYVRPENLKLLVSLAESPAPSDIVFDISTRTNYATGAKLAVQRFLVVLMSPQGADLMRLIPRTVSTTPQIRSVILNRVSLAVGIVRSRLRKNTPVGAPDDEVIVNAFVEGVSVNSTTGVIDARIRLVNLAGNSFILPLSV